MSFLPLTQPIDYIVLAGRRSPGLATIEGVDTPRNFQERRGFGISFATLRFRGVSLAKFKVLLRLYSEQDWSDWHEWKSVVARPTIEANPRRTATVMPRLTAPPMTIEHPILADLEITDVVVENVLQPVQTGDGEWTIEIRFIEYHAPIVALEQTQGALSRAGSDNAENAIAANSREIALLEAELSNPRGLAGS
jgi:hypothetical protein